MIINFSKIIIKHTRKFKVRESILLAIILVIIFQDMQLVFPPLIKDVVYIANHLINYPNFSYEDKIKEKVGEEYYDWTQLIKQKTSSESKLMLPPQMWPWPQSGNPEFSQYFLYPAKLLREDRTKLLKEGDTTHVAIAWGEGKVEDRLYGWPKFPVFSQKIYYLPQRRKTEVKALENLKEWQKNAQRKVNYVDKGVFDLTYTESLYDYWLEPINTALLPTTKFAFEVKTNWSNSTALIAKVSFNNNEFAIFSSPANQKIDRWEKLNIVNLYSRASRFAYLRGWSTKNMKVEGIGLDLGHPAKMPYFEKWGLIEVEQGGLERIKSLNELVINNQTLMSLGNIYNMQNNDDKAKIYYEEASYLDPSEPWNYFWLAEIAKRNGNMTTAETFYNKSIELSPEISWFYYSLGVLYQQQGKLDQAINKYQESVDLYPESFWAHRALGEVYERQGNINLAYQNFKLASDGPRKDTTYDGRIARIEVMKIESEQLAVIKDSLDKIVRNPNDLEARYVLGKAYIILGELKKAKEQYTLAFKINPYGLEKEIDFPPKIVDQLAQPVYGTKGKAVEVKLLGRTPVVLLNNYHSYLVYSKEFFPVDQGTIELKWQPTEELSRMEKQWNLLYQFKGFWVWVRGSLVSFAVFDKDSEKWLAISSQHLITKEKFYRITVSYGKRGMYLFLDGKTIAHGEFSGGINDKNDINLGRGPLLDIDGESSPSGYFETIKIYDYQKLKME